MNYHCLHFRDKKMKLGIAQSLAQAPQLGGRQQTGTQWLVNNSRGVNKEGSLSSRALGSCEEVGLRPGHSEVE